jgi:hypothetical protein
MKNMKKIILTEDQIDLLRKNAQQEDERRYRRNVTVDAETYGVTYKGMEINDFAAGYEIRLTYLIEQEHRSWGIKDISLYSIEGPESLEFEVEYFIDDNNTETETITLPVNWENIETDTQTCHGVVTIGNTLVVSLKNNESGEIVIDSLNLEVYNL